MEFKNIGDLVNQVNTNLGEFCNEFGRKRKELAGLGKVPKRGILFKYEDEKRDWAINEGGGTEVQYHLTFNNDDAEIRYGLGFNTQTVQFKYDMTPVEYMQPYMNGFLKNAINIKQLLPDYNFVYGNVEKLKNPNHNEYTLFGKTIIAEEKDDVFFIEDNVFNTIITDLIKQFEAYQIIFTEKNNFKKVAMNIQNSVTVLLQKGQIILQGPPGTGKTYTAKDIAEQILLSKITDDKKQQKANLEDTTDQFKLIQFHPAYSYEDFVRGIVAESKGTQIDYVTKNKVLAKFANEAYKNWKASTEPKEKVAKETWVQNTLDDFKDFLSEEIEDKEEKLMITGKAYINRITENSIRFNSDAWEIDGGVPVSDIVKMYLADATTRRQIKDNPELTKTAKSLSTYWLKILELFRKYIADKNLTPIENGAQIAEKKYVLIIDEINRANLPAVLGELIYALEYRGEKVESMYPIDDDNTLIIPPNLYIIGTMNTSDRSVGHIDYAIRRRFAFIDLLPKVLPGDNFVLELFKKVSALFIKNIDEYIADNSVGLIISEHLSQEFRPADVWLGHSYFIKGDGDFTLRKNYEIVPILKEYVNDGILKQTAVPIINAL